MVGILTDIPNTRSCVISVLNPPKYGFLTDALDELNLVSGVNQVDVLLGYTYILLCGVSLSTVNTLFPSVSLLSGLFQPNGVLFYSAKDYAARDSTHYIRLEVRQGILRVSISSTPEASAIPDVISYIF